MNSQSTKLLSNAPNIWGVVCRPTVLFVVAFALCVTPHEAVHAITSYLLGFSSTLFQMWVNPDAADATPTQLATIAAAGPIFSLAAGLVFWAFYQWRFRRRPSGLLFLMLAIVGIYSFLGPLAGSALGGDFATALTFLGAPNPARYAASIIGFILLPVFMFFMGRRLVEWAPADVDRAPSVVCTTVAPWLIGTMLVLLVYWPLPPFLVGSTLGGSAFWVFAVLGAALGFSNSRPALIAPSFTRPDLVVAALALAMVRLLVHGVRLAH